MIKNPFFKNNFIWVELENGIAFFEIQLDKVLNTWVQIDHNNRKYFFSFHFNLQTTLIEKIGQNKDHFNAICLF